MAAVDFRVLSQDPLNAEPPVTVLARDFVTPTSVAFHRNHGALLDKDTQTYRLEITSEVPGLDVAASLTYEDILDFDRHEVTAALSCAGNRRIEMNEEKDVEGLQWGGSAIFNSRFSGALLRDVVASFGIRLGSLEDETQKDLDELHLHFETTQECEEDTWYGSSIPVSMALDRNRPCLLAYAMNGEPLTQEHGRPLRLVAPGLIGARSVKWLERIVLRERPSDNFYMTSDYKVLPPEATPDTKKEYLKQVEPLMALPLNSEICVPIDGDEVKVDLKEGKIQVRGYALGSEGTPIQSVNVAIVPLPFSPSPPSPPNDARDPESTGTQLPHPELHQIRLAAKSLADRWWTCAHLVTDGGKTFSRGDKCWAWTLFHASIDVPEEVVRKGGESKVAIVAYAEDIEGNEQELQTTWNLRGVAEASWSVKRVTVRFV
ncbi:hypothetical protein JCM10212_002080 [Sporobolomyces blumeae]